MPSVSFSNWTFEISPCYCVFASFWCPLIIRLLPCTLTSSFYLLLQFIPLFPLLVVSSATSFFNFLPYVDSATYSSRLVLRLFHFFLCCFFYTFDSSCTCSSAATASASSPSLLLFLLRLFIANQLEDSPNYPTARKFFFVSLLYRHAKMITKFRLSDCKAILHVLPYSIGLIKIKKGKNMNKYIVTTTDNRVSLPKQQILWFVKRYHF